MNPSAPVIKHFPRFLLSRPIWSYGSLFYREPRLLEGDDYAPSRHQIAVCSKHGKPGLRGEVARRNPKLLH